MILTPKDVELFHDDPTEFIRKQLDFTEGLFNPRNTCSDLLSALCNYKSNKKRKKPDYLHSFLNYCGENLIAYTQQASPDWKIKEALLFCIGMLRDNIDT